MAEIGIEQARKSLGDIANRAGIAGTITYLTRNGRRIAAVVPLERIMQTTDPAAFTLVFVDDGETADRFDLPQTGAVVLTLYGATVAYCPDNRSVDEAIEWGTMQVAERTGVLPDYVGNTQPRDKDIARGQTREVAFHEVPGAPV